MHQWWIGSGREWLYRIQVGNVSHGLAKILYLQIDLANNVIAIPTRSEVRKMIKSAQMDPTRTRSIGQVTHLSAHMPTRTMYG